MPHDVRSYIDQPSAFARRPENVLDGTVGLTVAFRGDVLTLKCQRAPTYNTIAHASHFPFEGVLLWASRIPCSPLHRAIVAVVNISRLITVIAMVSKL